MLRKSSRTLASEQKLKENEHFMLTLKFLYPKLYKPILKLEDGKEENTLESVTRCFETGCCCPFFLSDKVQIRGYTWKALKASALRPEFTSSKWFNTFTEEEKEIVKKLIEAQKM